MNVMSSNLGFTPLSRILSDELIKLADGRFAPVWNIEKRWRELVGQTVARQSRVLHIKNGILHVGVNNSAWLYELGFMKGKILSEIQSKMPSTKITDIKFKMI